MFWHQGYRSTSLQQLIDGMGINKSSFYAAFDSKAALFVSILDYYWEQTQATITRIRTEKSGLAAIRAFADATIVDIPKQERALGCLAVNSVLELAGVDQELHKHANQILVDIEAELHSLLVEAKDIGEMEVTQTPAELSKLLMLLLQGLRVSCRRSITTPKARASVDAMMQALGSA